MLLFASFRDLQFSNARKSCWNLHEKTLVNPKCWTSFTNRIIPNDVERKNRLVLYINELHTPNGQMFIGGMSLYSPQFSLSDFVTVSQ